MKFMAFVSYFFPCIICCKYLQIFSCPLKFLIQVSNLFPIKYIQHVILLIMGLYKDCQT